MSELGNRLKQARQDKNLSLDDLQGLTKIQKRYLVGIEEGNYAVMPGKFYVRAFIKQYCEAVGLDPDEIFEEYKNEVPSTYNDDVPEQLSRVKTHKELPKSASKAIELLPRILIAVLVIAAVIVAYILFISGNNNNQQNQSGIEQDNDPAQSEYTPLNEEEEPAGDTEDSQGENEEAVPPQADEEGAEEDAEAPAQQQLTAEETAATAVTYTLSGTEEFQLEISSTDSTWVGVKNGKGTSFFGDTVREGAPQTFDLSAEEEITVRIGNTAATALKVNGQPVELGSDKTRPQNIKIIYSKE
ncbi:helix-turn-helix domain-containing protein [Metabacillus lacus]|uniref:helix-turn-helix domain-containing protein n=1 Tax=Metabacillus lacus TaxID=1983721 RepID=UPI0012B10AC0|nr:RodZ domain-containing protein [Metabacillus lacus]